MHRRGFLRVSGSSMASFAPWPWVFNRHKAQSAPSKGVTQTGKAEPFSYADLKGLAHTLAAGPYRRRPALAARAAVTV